MALGHVATLFPQSPLETPWTTIPLLAGTYEKKETLAFLESRC